MGVLPEASVHGSSLFSRGNTQVLAAATLGPALDGVAPASRSALGGSIAQRQQQSGGAAHLTTLGAAAHENNASLPSIGGLGPDVSAHSACFRFCFFLFFALVSFVLVAAAAAVVVVVVVVVVLAEGYFF